MKETLPQIVARLEKQVKDLQRVNHLNRSTVTVNLDDDVSVDLDVPGAVFSGIEAGVDANNAQITANAAARTYNQPNPPLPSGEVDGKIPEGSLWMDTDNDNLQFRWTAGAWVQVPLGENALNRRLIALITMRFDTEEDRDAALPTPSEGMEAFVLETGLSYQWAAGQWVPLQQFVRKGVDQSAPGTTYVGDNQLRVTLVPGWHRIEALLHLRGNPDGDVTLKWSFSGVVLTGDSRHCLGPATSADTGFATLMRSTGNNFTSNIRYGVADASSDLAIREDLLFQVATAGELRLWFAQYASASGSATIGEQSRLFVTKVN